MVMGIGRGDSSRRVVGLKPLTVDEFERRITMIKDLMNGRKVEWNGKEIKLAWARKDLPQIPMHVAGYGPRALGVAGRIGRWGRLAAALRQVDRIEEAKEALTEAVAIVRHARPRASHSIGRKTMPI
jgi:hypothetical protein